jgi:endoglycosylceramidase
MAVRRSVPPLLHLVKHLTSRKSTPGPAYIQVTGRVRVVPSRGVPGRFRLVIAALLTAALISVPAAGVCQAAAFDHAGRWLTDASGRVLILHGLDFAAKRPPYLPSRIGFDADDARWIAAQGFSVVRLGFIPTGVVPTGPGAWDEAYLDDYAATVRTLAAAGVLVIVDAHQDYYTESTGGEGFPGWMVTRQPVLPASLARSDAPAFDGFWADDRGIQGQFAAMWAHVAARLRDTPGVLGFDLLNEPFPGSREQECAQINGCPAFDQQVLTPFYRRVIAAIRGVDPTRLVFYEPQVIANQGVASDIGPLGDAHAVFAPHIYCSASRVGAPPCLVREPSAFTNAENQAAAAHDGVFLGEFGATDDADAIGRIVSLADSRMVSWSEWAYWNQDPCCERPHEGLVRTLAAPPGGDNVKPDKLAALARPYPRVTAGTPAGWTWDAAAHVFSVSWSTARAGGGARFGSKGISELVLPPAAFPGRFRVSVRGGRIYGPRGARRLRIRGAKGATSVSVTVRAG